MYDQDDLQILERAGMAHRKNLLDPESPLEPSPEIVGGTYAAPAKSDEHRLPTNPQTAFVMGSSTNVQVM